MFGYTGKLLFVNLSNRSYEVKELPEEWARNYLGGSSLGSRVLWEYMPPNTHPYAEASMVGFVSGCCNNTGVLFGERYMVVSKSPVYNGWNDSNSGGYFGPALKKAGYDAVFVSGISDTPVYIKVDNGRVSIEDAADLWGKEISKAEQALYKQLGDSSYKYAMIGPAGEKKSPISAVINDGHRAAARGGTAAVMGSKKLKAVVCRGSGQVDVFSKERIIELNKKLAELSSENPAAQIFKEHGTSAGTVNNIKSGDCPVKNFASEIHSEGLTGDEFLDMTGAVFNPRYKTKSWGCATCLLKCGAMLDIPDSRWPMKDVPRPEYESLGWLSAGVMCRDFPMVAKCNDLCNEYGVDVISANATVSWIMDCYNDGILTRDDLDGIEPVWGNAEAVVGLHEKICMLEGCGKLFGMGSYHAAKELDLGYDKLAVSSGIETSAHDPRFAPGFARAYQFDPAPGKHNKGSAAGNHMRMSVKEKYDFRLTAWMDFSDVMFTEFREAAGMCRFIMRVIAPTVYYDFVEAVTGWSYPARERYYFGMRSFTSRQAFNLREGLRRKDFWISGKLIGSPPLKDGPNAGLSIDNERQCDNLYNLLGYKEDGMPLLESLIFMQGVDHIIKEFYPEAAKGM